MSRGRLILGSLFKVYFRIGYLNFNKKKAVIKFSAETLHLFEYWGKYY